MKTVYLLDTSIVSEPASAKPCPSVLESLARHEGMCAIPAIVWHELRFGVERLPEGTQKTRLAAFLSEVVSPFLPIIPYEENASYIHAHIRVYMEAPASVGSTRAPRLLPFADGQIAAIAMANNLVLVTRNVENFRYIRNLMVESWFE